MLSFWAVRMAPPITYCQPPITEARFRCVCCKLRLLTIHSIQSLQNHPMSDEESLGASQDALVQQLSNRDIDALYELKRRLRSRCPNTQMEVAKVLLTCLEDEPLSTSCPFRKFMLEEDMVGFLCDAMATSYFPLIKRLCSVLELLADCDEMLADGHAVLAAETAQRRAYLLGLMAVSRSSEDCQAALRAILGLLSTLLLRVSTVSPHGQRSVSNLCPPLALLSTLRLILDGRATARPSMTQSAALTLYSVLQVLDVEAENVGPSSLADSVASCVRTCLPRLVRLASRADQDERRTDEGDEDDDDDDEEEALQRSKQACQLICSIVARIVSLRASCKDLAGAEGEDLVGAESDDASAIMEALEAEAVPVMLEQCLPRVLDQVNSASSSESGCRISPLTSVFLDSLETCLKLGKDPVALADSLACKDFLWLLPLLQRLEPHSTLALRVLCSILAHLAYDLLDAETWWPQARDCGSASGSAATLATFLCSATEVLASNSASWPKVLEQWPYLPVHQDAGSKSAAQLFVLLLTYFRSIAGCDSGPQEGISLAHSLPHYIMSLPHGAAARIPCSILKMTWISFAVHCVLVSGAPPPRTRAANDRLTHLLLQLPHLKVAYTHHPALLYWVFQQPGGERAGRGSGLWGGGVPPRLQQQVLELWLDRRESPTALQEIMCASRAAVHLMLDVVSSGAPQVAHSASRILAEAATKNEAVAADLVAGLWEALPLSLSRCTARDGAECESEAEAESPSGVGGLLVWLAAEFYQPPAADKALRVASLLSVCLGRQRFGADPQHHTAALHVLSNILKDCRRRSDPRVHMTILSDGRFAQAVLGAARGDDGQVRIMALHLLRQLEEDKALLKTPVSTAVELDKEVIQASMFSPDVEVFKAGLLLIAEVLKPKPQPFLTLQLDDKSLRALYFRLQNQALKVKILPEVERTVWCVMTELVARHPPLCQQPWNYVLVKTGLRVPVDTLSEDFLAFISAWLRTLKPAEPPRPTPRRPMPSMLTQTAIEIASAVTGAEEAFRTRPVVRDICKALLAVTANLPPGLRASVQEVADSLR